MGGRKRKSKEREGEGEGGRGREERGSYFSTALHLTTDSVGIGGYLVM